jgi:DNA-binding PadR family transcriptional regulator
LRIWITEVLKESGPQTTERIHKLVSAKTGLKYHMNSMYLALRSLKKSGGISVVRKGRQRFYAVGKKLEQDIEKVERSAEGIEQKIARRRGRPPKSASAPAPATPALAPAPSAVMPAAAPAAPSTVHSLPHKIGVGEVAIVGMDKDHVLSATNVQGELVLKRHPVPPK